MFVSGERVRLFAVLVGVFFAVAWCFLYVLGIGQSIVRTLFLAVVGVSFLVWRVVDLRLSNYELSNWKKDGARQGFERLNRERRSACGYLFL